MIETASSTPPAPQFTRKSVAAERGDLALAWIAAVGLGVLGISFVPEASGAVRMLLPLVCMVGFLIFALGRERHSKSKVADSVYFMGFIWTLWALIDVLIGKPQQRAAELYVAFGYALTATTGGIFLRLVILQFYRTLDDQEREAVDAIDQRVARLVAELENSQQHLADLRGHAMSALTKWHSQFADASKAHTELIGQTAQSFASEGAGLTTAVRDIRTSVSLTGRAFSDAEKKLSASSEKITTNLSSAVDSLELAIRDMTEKVKSVEVPADTFSKAMKEPLANLDAAVTPIRQVALATLKDLNAAIHDVSGAIKSLPQAGELRDATQGAIANLTAAASAAATLAGESGQAAEALSSVRQIVEQTEELLRAAGARADRDTQDMGAAVQQVSKSARETSDVLKDVVRFVHTELSGR